MGDVDKTVGGVSIKIKGADKLTQILTQHPSVLRKELMKELQRLGIKLAAKMKQKLSGEVLNVKTGRLRRSINSDLRTVDSGTQANSVGGSGSKQTVRSTDTIYQTVGTNVSYAAVHEYGFNGTVTIRAHQRKRKSQANKSSKGRDGNPEKKRTSKAKAHQVKQHIRRLRLPERSFARSALAEFESEMSSTLASVLTTSLKKEFK